LEAVNTSLNTIQPIISNLSTTTASINSTLGKIFSILKEENNMLPKISSLEFSNIQNLVKNIINPNMLNIPTKVLPANKSNPTNIIDKSMNTPEKIIKKTNIMDDFWF